MSDRQTASILVETYDMRHPKLNSAISFGRRFVGAVAAIIHTNIDFHLTAGVVFSWRLSRDELVVPLFKGIEADPSNGLIDDVGCILDRDRGLALEQ